MAHFWNTLLSMKDVALWIAFSTAFVKVTFE
jgi:hypothetical protein